MEMSTIQQVHIFCWQSIVLVVCPRLDNPFASQNPKEFCAFHFQEGFFIVHIPFVQMFKFKLLALISVNHLLHPVLSSLIIYLNFFLNSLIMILMVLSLSPHYLHLLFCCMLFNISSDIISSYGVVLFSQKSVSSSFMVSLSQIGKNVLMGVFTCLLLRMSVQFLLFPLFVFWLFLFCWWLCLYCF